MTSVLIFSAVIVVLWVGTLIALAIGFRRARKVEEAVQRPTNTGASDMSSPLTTRVVRGQADPPASTAAWIRRAP